MRKTVGKRRVQSSGNPLNSPVCSPGPRAVPGPLFAWANMLCLSPMRLWATQWCLMITTAVRIPFSSGLFTRTYHKDQLAPMEMLSACGLPRQLCWRCPCRPVVGAQGMPLFPFLPLIVCAEPCHKCGRPQVNGALTRLTQVWCGMLRHAVA